MKNSMTFDVLPMGLCGACLEMMVDPEVGQLAIHKDLGAGRALWGVYCEHNRSGAYTLTGPAHATQWQLVTPIDILEFVALVEKTVGFYHGAAGKGAPS